MKHRTHNRILSFFLALVMLCTNAPFPVNSVENGEENASKQPSGSSQLVYDYDTLKITKDGTQISSLRLQSHEKIEVSADGISANAEYQWQVQHPENDDVWVNIYDGTNQTISVTAALVGNVLRPDGTAKLRCRAYTEDYAYLTSPIAVTLLDKEVTSVPAVYYAAADKNAVMTADAEETAEEPPEFVTITIEYLRYDYVKNSEGQYVLDEANPTQAFSPYIATIQYNANFNAVVPVPTIVGYEAHLGDNDTAINTVTLDYTNLTGNRTITVKYLPAEVNYTVRYYFQNIYDDGYVEDTSQQKNSRGHTGSAPKDSDVKQDFIGFTSMFYQPDTIAADGSTVFEVYYERNYYLMDFDCNGGYGADPVYVRYGTYISIATPKKSGWVFRGWDLVKTDDPNNEEELGTPLYDENGEETGFYTGDDYENSLPIAMPHYNSAYKALWKTADTTYTVAYWIRNADGTNTFLTTREKNAVSSQVVSGQDDICGTLVHTHIASCVSCGYEEHTHHDHDIDCYAAISEGDILTNGADLAAIYAANGGQRDTESGYLYFIQTENDKNLGRYWPKIFIDGEYYTIRVYNKETIINADIYRIAEDADYESATVNGYTAYRYKAKLNCGNDSCNPNVDSCSVIEHTHNAGCYICGLDQHAHTNNCFENARHLEFVEAQQGVTVEGDGSTVVNVYYQYRAYTLKFYYAASTTTMVDSVDKTTYRVVGGSTYYFGGQHDGNGGYLDAYANYENSGTFEMLNRMFSQGVAHVGQTASDSVPSLNEEGMERVQENVYIQGSDYDPISGRTYYYISFTARYGDDISEKWPIDVFASVTMAEGYTTDNGATGAWKTNRQATVSAWNGEHHVWYSKNIANETIKGKYEKLDYRLLYDGQFADSTTVSFLCFWENGAKNGWNVPRLFRYNIWVEALSREIKKNEDGSIIYNDSGNPTHVDGTTPMKERDGVIYKRIDVYDTCDNSTLAEQTQPTLTGYTALDRDSRQLTASTDAEQLKDIETYFDSRVYATGMSVDFYYSVNRHSLKFYNYNGWLGDGQGAGNTQAGEGVQVGTPLSGFGAYVNAQYMKNHYPDGLEPGAYEFVAWYTTALCLEDTEVDWDNLSMPDSDLTVYAKWEPIVRNVTFYTLYSDIEAGEKPFLPTVKVPHGNLLETAHGAKTPEREGYIFIGWFYMDENGKKRFAPDSMEVKRDLDLFAEWKSGIDTMYEVYYVYDNDTPDDQTDDIPIASATVGHSTAGKTKTFNAKGGMELYNGYQTGYFPKTGSHSILMNEDSNKNTYVFEYVYDDSVLYKVQYLDNVTKLPIADAKIVSTKHAVVTERFAPVPGYVPMPGYYYQTKSLTADGDAENPIEANVITFYYMKDDAHGAYSIEYYVEDKTGSEEYNGKMYRRHTSFQNTADLKDQDGNPTIINSGVLANGDEFEILDFDGYIYTVSLIINYDDKGEAKPAEEVKAENVKGKLDANGLTIKLYYDKVSYPYEIQFLEYGTGNVLGYGKEGDNELYLNPPEAEAAFGDVIEFTASETLTIGSTIYEYYISNATQEQRSNSITIRSDENANVLKFYYTPKQYEVKYKAVCTDKSLSKFGVVSPSSQIATTVDQLEATATPYYGYRFIGWYTDEACENKVNSNWVNGTVLKPQELKEATYYALFEPITADLTINKTVYPEPADANHSFIFTIVGKDNNNKHVNLTISINGDGSVTIKDLPIGDYTITELSGWSYQYTADQAEKIAEVGESKVNEISFTNTYVGSDWLGDEDSVDNDFGTYAP